VHHERIGDQQLARAERHLEAAEGQLVGGGGLAGNGQRLEDGDDVPQLDDVAVRERLLARHELTVEARRVAALEVADAHADVVDVQARVTARHGR
jgi:hypothetical protein